MAAIAELKARLLMLPGIALRISQLERMIEVAQEEYAQLLAPYQEAKVRSGEGSSEVVKLHDAEVSLVPVAPIKVYHVALAGFLSLVISVGLAYLVDYARTLAPRTGKTEDWL